MEAEQLDIHKGVRGRAFTPTSHRTKDKFKMNHRPKHKS